MVDKARSGGIGRSSVGWGGEAREWEGEAGSEAG